MVFLDLRPVDNDRDRAGDRRTDRLSPGPMLRAISRHRLIRSCDTRTKWSNLRPAVVISAAPASGQGAQCCVVRVRRTAATTAATVLHFCPLWPELTFHTHTRTRLIHSLANARLRSWTICLSLPSTESVDHEANKTKRSLHNCRSAWSM